MGKRAFKVYLVVWGAFSGHMTFLCLGVSLFVLAGLVFAPNGIRHPPSGDAGHSSLLRQRRLTRRKPTLPGAEQSRVRRALVSSYGPSPAGICQYRFERPRTCYCPGIRGAAPGSGILAHSPICRYRHGSPRYIARQWFRGGAGAVANASGRSTWCHRAHDGTGAPATSWPVTLRATDGLKPVMSTTGGLIVNLGNWQGRGRLNRYRQKPANTPGRTTKPPRPNSLIALPPAGSAFFSLVFFAEAKKSDRRPPQGDVVFRWAQKPTPYKETAPYRFE